MNSLGVRVGLAAFSLALAGRAQNAVGIPDDPSEWVLVQQKTAVFDLGAGSASIFLLRSVKPAGTDGLGEPMNAVELRVLQGGRIIYDYIRDRVTSSKDEKYPLLIDEELEVRDVTGDGVPEILFHSGTRGASDYRMLEHILRYDPSRATFSDISPEAFYQSGRHGVRWLTSQGRVFAVIGEADWSETVPLEDRCHYCDTAFKYDVYEWGGKGFEVRRHLRGTTQYSEADEALEGDWELIRSSPAQ